MNFGARPFFQCDDVWPLLFEYLDDGLDADCRGHIDAHVSRCTDCQGVIASRREVAARMVAAGEVSAPSRFTTGLAGLLAADDLARELPGTFPEGESEAERIKRLSRFSTRKESRVVMTNDAINDNEAFAARTQMGRAPRPAIAYEPSLNGHTPQMPVERIDHTLGAAKVVRTRITWLYGAGIAASLVLVALVLIFGH
ncbi:MAG: hypothetical protein ABI743_05210, partial [bacterium]